MSEPLPPKQESPKGFISAPTLAQLQPTDREKLAQSFVGLAGEFEEVNVSLWTKKRL